MRNQEILKTLTPEFGIEIQECRAVDLLITRLIEKEMLSETNKSMIKSAIGTLMTFPEDVHQRMRKVHTPAEYLGELGEHLVCELLNGTRNDPSDKYNSSQDLFDADGVPVEVKTQMTCQLRQVSFAEVVSISAPHASGKHLANFKKMMDPSVRQIFVIYHPHQHRPLRIAELIHRKKRFHYDTSIGQRIGWLVKDLKPIAEIDDSVLTFIYRAFYKTKRFTS